MHFGIGCFSSTRRRAKCFASNGNAMDYFRIIPTCKHSPCTWPFSANTCLSNAVVFRARRRQIASRARYAQSPAASGLSSTDTGICHQRSIMDHGPESFSRPFYPEFRTPAKEPVLTSPIFIEHLNTLRDREYILEASSHPKFWNRYFEVPKKPRMIDGQLRHTSRAIFNGRTLSASMQPP
jgi:hypothetical protein